MDGENLADLYNQTHDAARIFQRVAQEIDDLTERLEHRTKDTPAWYGAHEGKGGGEGYIGAGGGAQVRLGGARGEVGRMRSPEHRKGASGGAP